MLRVHFDRRVRGSPAQEPGVVYLYILNPKPETLNICPKGINARMFVLALTRMRAWAPAYQRLLCAPLFGQACARTRARASMAQWRATSARL